MDNAADHAPIIGPSHPAHLAWQQWPKPLELLPTQPELAHIHSPAIAGRESHPGSYGNSLQLGLSEKMRILVIPPAIDSCGRGIMVKVSANRGRQDLTPVTAFSVYACEQVERTALRLSNNALIAGLARLVLPETSGIGINDLAVFDIELPDRFIG